ncbi:type I restriction endonuclease subunit S [Novosphingobium barchaimii LL02]|uniref:Type I restriction endonuclease subunit S n=1 Tax=Novosphingobium barchaimii LL02 TaxID=1114963 RepID=A0A0J7XU91_9SPHN|nr:type I restriction endonuclease subunit S [Novosphingobium barchaimii LL02]
MGWKGLKADEYVEEGYAMLATPNIKSAKIDFDGANRITRDRYDESPEIKLREGDVLLAKDGSTLGTVNFVRNLDRETTVNSSISVITPHARTGGAFLHYYFQADYVVANIAALKGGMGVPHLFQSDLVKFPLALPSLPEQQAIAAFLDRETAKIDALVAEQERLIALLKEKRQAVISHAVAKGLNPDAPMKDSGIEWLGQIPAHWELGRIKHSVLKIEQGWSPQCDATPVAGPDQWGVLKVGCVNGERFNPAENKALPDNLEPVPDLALTVGDVLISRANTRELVGGAALVEQDFGNLMLCDKLYRLRIDPRYASPAFITLYLRSSMVRSQIEVAATGASSSMLNIGQGVILELAFPIPPVEEQHTIAKAIRENQMRVAELVAQAQSAIALLQERRAALISAAVTGKIDVRSVFEAGNVVALPTKITAAALPSSRAVVGAYAIRYLGQMGRMAVMKVGYLAQAHVGVHELAGTYERYAAGPYDGDLINAMQHGAESICGIVTEEPSSKGDAVKYKIPQTLHMPSGMLEAALGPDRMRAFLNLIDLLKGQSREGVEAIATLYAVWNDLIASGRDVTDDAICNGVFDWHLEKREKFSRDTLENWLGWMRRNGVVPDGSAPRTDHQGDLFA